MSNGPNNGSAPSIPNLIVIMIILAVICGIAGYALHRGARPDDIALIGFTAFGSVILLFAAAVVWQLVREDALTGIVLEPGENPKASLSRFQMLVFTFVVAGLFLMLSIEAGDFVDIPASVLGLIGLSGGTFVVSKGVTTSVEVQKIKTDTELARIKANQPSDDDTVQ
ncbi:hypothetical protein LCL97_13990 [Seohaeicola saemankumensis]|nr:hypothetical protein [Seohaeicola saemankumensis]MCA0871946.1 hypothetical protein [Seohaeicola saemankumensis]